jgi:leucyl aminopeptidase
MFVITKKQGTTTDKDRSCVYFSKDGLDCKDFLNATELEYLQTRFALKKDQVVFNKNGVLLIVQRFPEKKNDNLTFEALRKEANKLNQVLNDLKIKQLSLIDLTNKQPFLYAYLEGLALSSYSFVKYFKQKDDKISVLSELDLHATCITDDDILKLNNTISAVFKARDLINEPVNELNAVKLAESFVEMAKRTGIKVQVYDKKEIEKLGFGGLLAVNKGSIDPPTFTILEWKPENAKNKTPIILVGKGVVFDTGGLSLKPTPDSMDYMKSDMSGAAAVSNAIVAIAKNKVPVYTIALIPATDNRPDGNAYAPGDIIKMHDGTTVEVLNTDAEGRMILADALSYAKQYKPQLVVNIATLTGSAAMAIGKFGIVAMGNADDAVFNQLENSGNKVHERIAHFPFWDDYAEMLKSDVADIQNIGGKYAGAITGGKFLEHFTDYPFIHLDIAGCAFSKENDSYRGKGGTGVAVRLLVDFITNLKF